MNEVSAWWQNTNIRHSDNKIAHFLRTSGVAMRSFYFGLYRVKRMSLHKLIEVGQLLGGFCRIISRILFERYIWRIHEPSSKDMLDSVFMSELMGRKIVAIAPTNKSISLGGGGTGTTRLALTLTLDDGSSMRVFVKLPTASVFERVFLTLFSVYGNEINFYTNILPLFPKAADSKCNWCPHVHAVR